MLLLIGFAAFNGIEPPPSHEASPSALPDEAASSSQKISPIDPMPAPEMALRPSHLTFHHGNRRERTLQLTNRSDRPVLVVQPGDGSSHGWRTPILRWKLFELDGTPIETELVGRCGLMGPIWSGELLELEPGASVRFSIGSPPHRLKPGRYRAVVEYEHDPSRLGTLARPTMEIAERIGASAAFRCETPPFHLIIAEPWR